jgi:hypothetical protein
MSKVVLRALDLIGQHLRTHKSGGGADAPLDLAKQVVATRMDNPAPAAPPVAEAAPKNTTQGSVFAPKPRVMAPSGLYSHAAEVAGQLPQAKGPAEQMIGMMKNAGVKPAELENAGMITDTGDVHPDFAGRTVTRDELHKHLVDSMPKVEEKVLGENVLPKLKSKKYESELEKKYNLEPFTVFDHMDLFTKEERNKLRDLSGQYLDSYSDKEPPKFKKWSLPGGENYREVLLKAPEQEHPLNVAENKANEISNRMTEMERNGVLENSPEWQSANSDLMKADIAVQTIRNKMASGEIPHQLDHFHSDHWHDPNVLAHLRMSDRTGPNGEKLLHVEELQSDWGQQGREHGFKNPEVESRREELTKSLADATQKRLDEFKRIHDQHSADLKPYLEAYKKAMAEADKKFFSSKQGYSETEEYNKVGEKIHDELAHLRVNADAKRDAAFNQYGTRYNDPIDKIKEELSNLPKSGNVPHGPYVTSTQGWTDLALKRVLKEAAEGGYHGVVFTPGAEHAKRYDLSKQIGALHLEDGPRGEQMLRAYGPSGDHIINKHIIDAEKELPDLVGKEAAEKLLSQTPAPASGNQGPTRSLTGLDLQTGGEGMKGYYDKIVPTQLQKLAKQHDKDAKLGTLRTNSLPEMIHLPITDKMRESVLKGQKAFADGGEVEEYRKGGSVSPEDAEMQRRMAQLLHPEHEDPAMVQRYLRAQESYEVPTHERGAYSARVLPMAAHDVTTKINSLGNAVGKTAPEMSWHEFHKIGKGGTLFTLGGDRSNLGRLTHINGEKLAWPVDLHAGTKYMTEPNEGAVWANAAGAASALQNNIREAAKKGPVYGAFAPMGPKSVDSSVNMFDALMAQVPKSGISADTAKAIDDSLKAGVHIKGTEPEDIAKREKAKQIMEKWPGIMNAKKARDFATGLSGEHRSAIIKHLESAPFQKEGFPSVGLTRAAITDPELLGVSGNMMGHHIVELHEGDYDPQNLAFEHSTYPVPTKGKFIGKIPLIERHVAQPDFTEQQIMHPSVIKKTGEPTIIHPYSPNAQGRSSYRGNTEMRQGIQPVNERMLESIEEKHGSDFAEGGSVHPAMKIHGVHIVGHNPIFHGDE